MWGTYASPSSSEPSDLACLLGAFLAGAFFVATPFAAFAGGGVCDSSRLMFIDAPSSSSEDTSPPARARSSSSTSDMLMTRAAVLSRARYSTRFVGREKLRGTAFYGEGGRQVEEAGWC